MLVFFSWSEGAVYGGVGREKFLSLKLQILNA